MNVNTVSQKNDFNLSHTGSGMQPNQLAFPAEMMGNAREWPIANEWTRRVIDS